MNFLSRLARSLWQHCCTLEDLRIQDVVFLAFPVIIGLVSAMGALLFRTLIELFQTLFWSPGTSFLDQVMQTPAWLVIAIPVAGGLIAGPIITFFVPEAKGPGVPEVIHSVAARHSTIRHRVTALKALVTSLLIGCGASLGREGPIIQIGASVGSSIAQFFNLNPNLRRVCLASGVAAGISATFNAPIAGTFFAIEVILLDIQISYVTHIIIASITASLLSRIFWGDFPTFEVGQFQMVSQWELGIYLILGIIAGALSIGFVKSIIATGDLFQRIRIPDWIKPALGGFGLGIVGVMVPYVLGVGYETVNLTLADNMGLVLALVVIVAKIAATSLCIGSGMSGGIFAPSLVIGAALGTLIDLSAAFMLPGLDVHPSHYALAGMGAMVAGTTLAPITAVMTVFELTYNYTIILPLMASCITSAVVVRLLFGYSIYEIRLLRAGVDIVRGHDVNILRDLQVQNIMVQEFETIRETAPFSEVLERVIDSSYPHFVVLDHRDELAGVLSLRDLKPFLGDFEELRGKKAEEFMTRKVITISTQDTLEKALHLFERNHISFLPVHPPEHPGKIVGILLKDDLLVAYDERVLKKRILSVPWSAGKATSRKQED
ncbi:MAG: chloride channel protein [Desulfovibrionales bacterium]